MKSIELRLGNVNVSLENFSLPGHRIYEIIRKFLFSLSH